MATSKTSAPVSNIQPPPKPDLSQNGAYLLFALSIITLIGSVVAAGLLHSQLGPTSYMIAGGGAAFSILSFFLSIYCNARRAPIPPTPPVNTPKRVTSVSVRASDGVKTQTRVEAPSITTVSTTKPEPVLQPLPHIFNLQFDPAHPLSSRLSAPIVDPYTPWNIDLLCLPLSDWLNSSVKALGVQVDTHYKQVQAIEERIRQLDVAIQLKERMRRTDAPVVVGALLKPWAESPLRVMLMMDDELSTLDLSSLTLPPDLMTALSKRIPELASIKTKSPVKPPSKSAVQPIVSSQQPPPPPPELPPLPPIFNLPFDPSHPLSRKPSLPESIPGMKGSWNSSLLKIPLSFWINPVPSRGSWVEEVYYSAMKLSENQSQVRVINQRLEEFDQAIQLKERLKRLNPYLTVNDLLMPWSDSPLKFALMTDDELSQLTLASIAKLEDSLVWQILSARILKLAAKKNAHNLPLNYTKTTIGDILLIDLPRLNAGLIHISPKDFPATTFLLIDVSELQKIDTNQLSSEQLNFIFSAVYYDQSGALFYHVRKLLPQQIGACFPLIKRKDLLINLSEAQILGCDFSKIDKTSFDTLFSCRLGRFSNAGQYLPKLHIDKIYSLIPHFSDEHWNLIGEAHAVAFDITKIPEPKRKEVCALLFSHRLGSLSNAAQYLPKLPIDRIYALAPYFSDEQWDHIGQAHALALELSKLPPDKRQVAVDNIFSTVGDSISSAARLIPRLQIEKVYEFALFFSEEQWGYLSKGQIRAFDFTKIPEGKRKEVFQHLFSTTGQLYSNAAKFLCLLSPDQLKIVNPDLDASAHKYLPKK